MGYEALERAERVRGEVREMIAVDYHNTDINTRLVAAQPQRCR